MKSHGFRSGTRSKFSKKLRKHGMPNISTYLQKFKNRDFVDIKINSAVTKKMPHKTYHGRTGRIYKVDERSVGVKVKRVVGNKEIEENIDVRIEHLKLSKCRDEFLKRSKEYFIKKELAIKNNQALPSAKRVMEGARKEMVISKGEEVVVNFKRHVDVF